MDLISWTTAPFWCATLVLVGLLGSIALGGLDHAGADTEALDAGPLGWLNFGRVPVSILLVIITGLFAAIGFFILGLAHAFDVAVTPAAAPILAGLASLGATRRVTRWIADILPRDESYAISDADLLGMEGFVTVGPLEAQFVGRARVVDPHGNQHFPRVRGRPGAAAIPVGSSIRLSELVGREYLVDPTPIELTLPAGTKVASNAPEN
jgi:hypothetical protein